MVATSLVTIYYKYVYKNPPLQPKTFGKKDGSPPVTGAHPSVQDYLAGSWLHDSQTGSLPSSGTASPVHLPRGPESVPASPEHFRWVFYLDKNMAEPCVCMGVLILLNMIHVKGFSKKPYMCDFL